MRKYSFSSWGALYIQCTQILVWFVRLWFINTTNRLRYAAERKKLQTASHAEMNWTNISEWNYGKTRLRALRGYETSAAALFDNSGNQSWTTNFTPSILYTLFIIEKIHRRAFRIIYAAVYFSRVQYRGWMFDEHRKWQKKTSGFFLFFELERKKSFERLMADSLSHD